MSDPGTSPTGSASAPAPTDAAARPRPAAGPPATPLLLDFFPLQEAGQTRISAFFDALREGRLTTTRCPTDGLAWPPRAVCPRCHTEGLEWVDLPRRGRLYAFSAVLAGAPLGMESDVPFVVGLVDLDRVPLRLFSRIAGAPWEALSIGQTVSFEPFGLPDGRVFYRFRAAGAASEPGLL
jgi:hypothetical protein